MASKNLTFDIFGRDRSASKTIRGVGSEIDRTGDRFAGFRRTAGIALAAVGVAAVKFGADAVQAYAEAEQAQNRLNFAYDQFPALADVQLQALRDLNAELATKTRYDDDAYAIGQAQLAQYGLTGQQIMDLTPLLADYAGKTGKDLPAAAEDLGKALLGQGRALKDVGIDFTDTGSLAGNFDAIMQGLRGQVGGFAEQDATTAAGKLDILRNKFGEVQEAVGEKLLDPLSNVMDELTESGAVEDLGTALGDVVQGFADLEEKTGFLTDFVDDMTGFGDMVDDIERMVDVFSNPSTDGLNKWKDEEFGSGGLFGADFWGDIRKNLESWDRDLTAFWEGQKENTTVGVEGVRTGMGGGFSAIGGDMSVFRQATGEQFAGTWVDADGNTRTGFGLIDSSTLGGLGVIGATLGGISPLAGGAFGAAWALAQTLTGTGWSGVDGSTRSGMGTVGSTLGGFRGVVQGPFAGASSWLFSSGQAIVQGFIDGIEGMVGAVGSAVGGVVEWARGFFPNSPAEHGVFAGSGWAALKDSGAAVIDQWQAGMDERLSLALDGPVNAKTSVQQVAPTFAPAIYVQNPWTGEYMEARMSETAGRIVTASERANGRISSRGSTGF